MEKMKTLKPTDWLILVSAVSIFLPHTLCVVVVVGCMALALFKYGLIKDVQKQKSNIFGFLFALLSLFVSLFYQNWIGAGISCTIFILIVYGSYIREHVNPAVFSYVIEFSLIASFLVCIYSLFQFNMISVENGYRFFDFHIFNSPKRRIFGTFQNANIYALILEFMLACCLYRFLETKNNWLKIWYVFLALFQFGVLLLTGCRAALVPLIFIIPVLLLCAKQYKLLIVYIICIIGLLSILFTHPHLIPRFNDFSTIESRLKIWKVAIKGIEKYPVFGNGPWTYYHIYASYHGHKAVFCHNIYLDMLLSHGIVGTILFICYIRSFIFNVAHMKNENVLIFGLMISLILIICIHGLVDGTINPLKTNLFLVMILCVDNMYKNTCQPIQ